VSLGTKRRGTATVTAPTTIRGQTTGPVAADGRELTWSLAGRPLLAGLVPAARLHGFVQGRASPAAGRPGTGATFRRIQTLTHVRAGGSARRLLAPTLRNRQAVARGRRPGEARGCQSRAGRQGTRGGWTRDKRKTAHYDSATPVAACLVGLASCTAPCPEALPSRRHRPACLFRIRNELRVVLVQLVRLSVVELIYVVLNLRFNINVIFIVNYFFSGRRCSYR
jgi:hypothetical protein